ncbi:hypothetical protein FO519_006108 [Halicephalobus sp. NKZ332]|nr:hypothetical protein FO519_006108 [Halicephalobus sp. NKZ332]
MKSIFVLCVFCFSCILFVEAHWASNFGFYKNKDYGPFLARFPRAKRGLDLLQNHSEAWKKFMECTNEEVKKILSDGESGTDNALEKQCRVVHVAYASLLKCHNPTGFTGAESITADTLFRNLKYVQSYCTSTDDKLETLKKKKLEDECVKKALSKNSGKMKKAEQEYSDFFKQAIEGKTTVSKEEVLCKVAADFSKAVLPYLRACGLSSQRIEYELGRIYLGTVSMSPVDDPVPLEKCFSDHNLTFDQHFLL